MWRFPFQLGLATLFVTTWLFAAVEGYLIDNFLLCKHNISVTFEVLCTRYNDYTDSCRTIIEIAKCLVEQACLYCSAEVAKRYSEWKVEMTRSKLKNKCDQREYHDMAKEMSDQCPDNRFTVILISVGILVAVLVLLFLASLVSGTTTTTTDTVRLI